MMPPMKAIVCRRATLGTANPGGREGPVLGGVRGWNAGRGGTAPFRLRCSGLEAGDPPVVLAGGLAATWRCLGVGCPANSP